MSLYSDLNEVLTPYAQRIKHLKADLGDVNTAMVDRLGTSVINASDFTVKTSYVQYAYSESEQSVTLTKTSTSQYDYQTLSTPINSLANILTVGKKYRMHYRADVISGTPDIRMVIRKSNNSSASLPLIVEDGEEGYLDFEATAEMSHISVFITYNENVGACKIKYSDIYLCEIEGKIAVDLTARTEIENVRSDLQESIDTSVSKIEEVTADDLGDSVIKAADFTVKTQNITYSYNSAEQSVTLKKTSTTQANYQALSTPVDFLVGKLTVGKTYRVHYRADVLSGNPEIRMAIRKSDNSSALPPLILQDGEDGYVDFVATADMSLISVFITFNTAVGACQIKYSELYLCEVNGKTAVDITARTEIENVRSHLSDANVYKTTILRMMSSMAYNASGASPQIYKDLFSMLLKLKESVSLIAFPAYTASGGKQGACTDGKYIYQCCGDADQYTYMSIIKYNITTGEIVSTTTFNGTPNFGHANDMTYDPVTGYLYICTMLSDGSVIRIDSKDMSYVDTIYLTNGQGELYRVYQFAFDRVTRHIISTRNTEYYVYDPDGTYITTVSLAEKISATEQGMETDGVYIYRITYAPSCIDVCAMSGERVVTYNLDISREPETMMYDWMGTYYLTGNGSTDGQFYIADLME